MMLESLKRMQGPYLTVLYAPVLSISPQGITCVPLQLSFCYRFLLFIAVTATSFAEGEGWEII